MKVYVQIPFTDAEGKHDVGEEVEFAPEDKDGVQRLLDYGVVSRSAPKVEDKPKADPKQQDG